MDLPDTITALGGQIDGGEDVTPPTEFFEGYDVFRAEVAQLFVRPWLAADHASRLAANGDYFRVDVGPRSVVVVREADGQIHALRNACLHAGYRVCEEEGGNAEQLFCQYHGWYYALDGRLTDPMLRPEEADRSRFRLPRFAMRIDRGLVLVDPSKVTPMGPEPGPVELGDIPESLADAVVVSRKKYPAAINWKFVRQMLWSSRDLVFGDNGPEGIVEFGPLSYVAWRGDEAVLVRLTPRFPAQSEFEVIQIGPAGSAAANGDDRLAEALRRTSEAAVATPLAVLERPFYEWYWAEMSAPPVN